MTSLKKMNKSKEIELKIIYDRPLDEKLDKALEKLLKKFGWKWGGSGLDFKTEKRDLAYYKLWKNQH